MCIWFFRRRKAGGISASSQAIVTSVKLALHFLVNGKFDKFKIVKGDADHRPLAVYEQGAHQVTMDENGVVDFKTGTHPPIGPWTARREGRKAVSSAS